METLKESFIERFNHDLWANEIWIDVIDRLKDSELSQTIMKRYQNLQQEWLRRCMPHKDFNFTEGNLKLVARENAAAWLDYVHKTPISQTIDYLDEENQQQNHTLEQILHNLLSYGSFIRGALYGFARSTGIPNEQLPKTSPMIYTAVLKGKKPEACIQ